VILEVLLAVGLVIIGVLLIVARRPFLRLIRVGLTRFFGPAVAEESTDPRRAPTAMVIVGIGAIAFGVFNAGVLMISAAQLP